MRAIGKGGAAARIFCGLMNLPPPPAKFERQNSLFLNVLKTISEDSMNAAVHEAVIANDNNSNIAVAVDGTWHKRGYSSLNGVVCPLRLLRTERLSTLKLSQNIVLHPDGHGYKFVSSVRALVPQKFSVEEELMHVKYVEGQKVLTLVFVEVWKGSYQLRYRPRHLTAVQKYVVARQ
ncbi:uncharacterized protein TNCV_4862321 [Trichonephila clavipes]|nr:uncharacterized protein TNCV_4862321 [Trichonephila clavipes]